MTGLTSIRLRASTSILTTPAAAARPAKHLPSSSSTYTALYLPLFCKRPAGRGRAVSAAAGVPPWTGQGQEVVWGSVWFVRFRRRGIGFYQDNIGVVSLEEAIQSAEDAELDLVILSADADPPVLRIVDYKYNIDSHDSSVRLKAARRFLKDGDKVKVIVNLKRCENDFRDMAIELLKRFQDDVGELATEESKNFRDKNMFIVLLPNKAILRKGQEPPRKKEAPATEVSANVNV